MTSLSKKKMNRKEQNCSPTKTRGIVHKAGAAAFFQKIKGATNTSGADILY
jgi:hypothetical protein